ncbi:DUF2207 domain-containing protein, partial [Desulfosarcina cetonica]|uniref:DUF2207 domain-containing protein n=1 Tax=Desulfosarcina cetonica TaxID=90730 RepID=UPI00155D8BB8
MRPIKVLPVVVWLLLFLAPGPLLAARERIRSYDSRIDIHTDGQVVVTETLRVVSTANQIRHGIYRDFPTRYRNDRGGEVVVRFDVLDVRRDGRPEAYHTQSLSNGIRVYMGKKDVLLKPGEYTYTLVYRTDRQIGFFDDYDELYWNVTGNGWDFAIDQVQARVRLPAGADVVRHAAYTGPAGDDGRDFTARHGWR